MTSHRAGAGPFGELDTQVDVKQNRPVLEAALAKRTGGPDEYLALEMAFMAGFLETISGWLLEHVDVVASP